MHNSQLQARGAKFGQGSHQLKFEVKGKGTSHVHSARRTLCWPGFNLSRQTPQLHSLLPNDRRPASISLAQWPTPGFNLPCPTPGFNLSCPTPGFNLSHPTPGFNLSLPMPGFNLSRPMPSFNLSYPMPVVKCPSGPCATPPVKERRGRSIRFPRYFCAFGFLWRNQNFYHFLNLLWVFYPFPN